MNVVFDAPPPPPPPYPPPSPAQKRRTQLQTFGTNKLSQRQQIDPPPLKCGSTNDNSDNATRARLYKAEAYEDKVRIASQDQRIQELQAEIEEMRLFQKMEAESRDTAYSVYGQHREHINKDDAELIEALAVELETMEKDMIAAQARVAELELEKELRETRVKWEDASKMSSSPTQREAELIKQLELKQQELNNAKNDAKEGINIVKDLHGALRLARAERDEARSTLSSLRSGMEQKVDGTTDQIPIVRDLEVALKTMRRERDEALLELSSLFEEVNSLRECSAICEKLELSNKSLQTEIEKIQSSSEPDVNEQLLEAHAREGMMKQQNDKLVQEMRQMESALGDIVRKYEEQRTELSMQTATLKEVQDLHVTNIADINKKHASEVEQMRLSHEDAIKSLESRHEQELRLQSELFKSQERDWEEKIGFLQEELSNSGTTIKEYKAIQSSDRIEIENLQKELKEMNVANDELLAGLQMENANLNAELQRKLEEYKHVTSELESKSLELIELQSSLEQQPLISDGEVLPKTETSFTQDVTEAEAAVSYQVESSTSSDQMSRVEKLERELARSKKVNITLEDALRDMQVALVAVSSRKTSPLRREIENRALREYCAHRLLVDE